MTVNEAHALIGGEKKISRRCFYDAAVRGDMPCLRLGKRRILIPTVAFAKWLEGNNA